MSKAVVEAMSHVHTKTAVKVKAAVTVKHASVAD